MKDLLLSGTTLSRFFQVLPLSLLVGGVYGVCRFARRKKRPTAAEILRILFVCYLTGLVNLVLVPANLWTVIWFYLFQGYDGVGSLGWFSGGFNLTPTLLRCLSGELRPGPWVREMLAGNLLMFLPLGLFPPLLSSKWDRKAALLLAAGVPLAMELLQPIVGRSFDVDDLICNALGILCGYALARWVKK